MKYDVGNRLVERSLSNRVKSVYQYDDLDRVKSIVHTNAQGQVLASVAYDRNGIGEPTKITREDNTYVTLKYDEALRVKEESYYSATGTLQETIAYTYDASGKRTAKSDRNGTDTYNYKPGFQLDSITGTSGAEDYEFDANGRLTLIERDGVTRDLGHDAGDRLTSVANITTGETTQYVYDGQGNRVGAIEGSEVRQFLVAPGMGSGLNSTDLIADGNGNVISNYVYAGGASPFMMLDANGSPVYYLTDAMGTTIGLADRSGTEVGDFRYDSFGNLREEWGWAIGSAGGDFRFQGQWLEEDTGIYYFRARDYDTQTGMFLSRDAVDPIQQHPEAMNPYQFAYSNPFVYSDPTGMFTITELNTAQNLQTQLSNVRTFAGNQAKDYLKEKIGDAFSEVVASVFNYFVPGTSAVGQLLGSVSQGASLPDNLLENMIIGNACKYFEGIPLLDNLRLYPTVQSDGTPSGGRPCAPKNEPRDPKIQKKLDSLPGSHPEFIFINGNYARNNPNSFIIGDIKLTQRAAYKDITENDNQWKAMANYAREWQILPFVSYLSLLEDVPGSAGAHGISKSDRQKMAREALEKNVILVLGNLID